MLNQSKSYGTVCGIDPNIHYAYEQDDKYFNHQGYEVNPETGEQIEFPVEDDTADTEEPAEDSEAEPDTKSGGISSETFRASD